MNRKFGARLLVATTLLLVGCVETTSQTNEDVEAVVEHPTSEGDATPDESPVEATANLLPAAGEPQQIEFQAADGTSLVGTYWPAPIGDTPSAGILLMHWNPGTRKDWHTLATLLQGDVVSSREADNRGYAVFAFDFRGHGESGGSQDRAGYLLDAQAGLELLQGMPGVDSSRIVLIGASIGADAAVDVCGEGCTGAVALSPGNYLGVPYVDAVAALGGKPVLCAASENDSASPELCRDGSAAAQVDYQVQIYQGSAHGMQMFDISEEEPALIDLIFQWLDTHVPPG